MTTGAMDKELREAFIKHFEPIAKLCDEAEPLADAAGDAALGGTFWHLSRTIKAEIDRMKPHA